MELAIIIVGILLLITGLVGSVLPALPGPPLAFLSLLLLVLVDDAKANMASNHYTWFIVLGVITSIITALDYYLPIWGTVKFGGTKAGLRGSTVGLIVSVLLTFITSGLGVVSLIVGPFVGAYLGEKIAGQTSQVALLSAKGSLMGFIAGSFLKVFVVIAIGIYFTTLLV